MKAKQPEYIVTLKALPDPSDPMGIRRLKAFLKAAIRGYRLKPVKLGYGNGEASEPADEST